MDNLGASARAAGLADAYVAVPGDANSIFFNPAGLAEVTVPQTAFHHHMWLEGIRQETAAVVLPMRPIGAFAFAVNLIDYGLINERDSSGDITGTLRPQRYGVSFAWGQKSFKHIALGGTLRGAAQSLSGETNFALSTDIGGLWTVNPRLRLGVCYSNWGTYVQDFLMAPVIRVGASYQPDFSLTHKTLLATSLSFEPGGVHRIHFGAEDRLYKQFALRAGYQLSLNDNPIDGFYGLAAGVGLRASLMNLDYAFQPYGELGSSHRISLTYEFPGVGPSKPKPTKSPTPTPTATPTSTPVTQPVLQIPTPVPPASTPTLPLPKDNLKLYFRLPEDNATSTSLQQENVQAIQTRLKEIAENPSNSAAWLDLGRLYVLSGQKEAAIQCLEQVLRLRPEDAGLKAWLDKYKALPPTTPLR